MRSLIAVVVLAACSSPSGAKPAEGSGSAGPSAACKTEVVSLQDYLRTLEPEVPNVLISGKLALAKRPGLPPPPHAVELQLGVSQTILRNNLVPPHELDKHLGVERQIQDEPDFAKTSPGYAGHAHELVILIDQAIPWSDVADALNQAAAHGFDHLSLVFEGTTIPPPPHTAIDDLVKHGDRGIMVALAPTVKAWVKQCPRLGRAFDPPERDDWFDKVLIPRIGEGLSSCDCALPMAEVRSLLYYASVGLPKTGGLEVRIAKSGTAVSLPRAMPWREAAAKITGGTIHPIAK